MARPLVLFQSDIRRDQLAGFSESSFVEEYPTMRAAAHAVAARVVPAVLPDLAAAIIAAAGSGKVSLAAALWAVATLGRCQTLATGRATEPQIEKMREDGHRQRRRRGYDDP